MILDSKRGDIGSTAAKYAQESFERYGADSVTVNPYLGFDSVEPYLKWKDRGVIILCRTSNPGARDFRTWSPAASACIATWPSASRATGMPAATACW